MITKVVINNNGDTPIEYLSGLGAFRNGKTYEFKPGVNIIVGKNGCGKTTLMNLIRKYLLVDLSECSAGMFNSNINAVCFGLGDDKHMYAGADVVHNPLLICALSKNPEADFIEMTRGYVKNIRKMVKKLV